MIEAIELFNAFEQQEHNYVVNERLGLLLDAANAGPFPSPEMIEVATIEANDHILALRKNEAASKRISQQDLLKRILSKV
jgi:hypothetical protein